MPERRIVQGQRVADAKVLRARQFRKELTLSERLLWNELRGNKLRGFHFRRQQIIDGFIVDFYCHAAGLVIEVDGSAHDDRKEYDEERDGILTARNLRILRLPSEAILRDLLSVLEQISQVLHQSGHTAAEL